jgi:ubiquinone biosynthesis O-methyltransferase
MNSIRKRAVRSVVLAKSGLHSVNNGEVLKFSKVNWWAADSAVGPLHDMNPARVQFIRQSLARRLHRETSFPSKQLSGLSILDVGCGGGLLAESLSRLGAIVTGIDPSEKNIETARSHSLQDPATVRINYENATIGC